MLESVYLQGIKFLPVDLDQALGLVVQHIPEQKGGYFCFANIHVVMEAKKNSEFRRVLNQSAGNFPDGMGTAGALKILGHRFKDRVRGTDFMLRLCDYAAKNNLKVFLYGNTEDVIAQLNEKLSNLYPGIRIVGAISPPFRELTVEEDQEVVQKINESEADILFISLGAPKQEIWMAKHKGHVEPVQLGVGAAFDFITGEVKQAPRWMQKAYLEWLYRLPQQPRKTFYRMSLTPSFAWEVLLQKFRAH